MNWKLPIHSLHGTLRLNKLIKMKSAMLFTLALAFAVVRADAQPAATRFSAVDRVIEEGLAAKLTPGAVVLVGRDDAVL